MRLARFPATDVSGCTAKFRIYVQTAKTAESCSRFLRFRSSESERVCGCIAKQIDVAERCQVLPRRSALAETLKDFLVETF